MSAQFIIHTVFLISALLLTVGWTNNLTLAPYTLQLIGILVIFYFLNHLWQTNKFRLTTSIDAMVFSTVTLLLVYQTGGLTSPLFYLIYILLFGLSLLLSPLVTLIFSLLLSVIFYPQANNLNALLQIIGLLLMSPLALFFGRQYLQILESEEKIKIISQKKQALEHEVCQQEEDTLLWLSLTFKEQVGQIIEHSSDMLADLGHLNLHQKEHLEKINENAKKLLALGDKLKEKIEG